MMRYIIVQEPLCPDHCFLRISILGKKKMFPQTRMTFIGDIIPVFVLHFLADACEHLLSQAKIVNDRAI